MGIPSKSKNLRNPDRTKTSILQQATVCFSKYGFHGAGINDICKRAKINKRMIYHYFGNKKDLYQAVHQSAWEELAKWFGEKIKSAEYMKHDEKAASLASPDIRQILLQSISIFHDFVEAHPLFVRLLMWDGLEGGAASRSLWDEMRGPIFRQIEALVCSAQDSGYLSKKLQASHLIISLMGAVAFYFSHAHTMIDIFQKQPLSKQAIEERKNQVMEMFRELLDGVERSV